MDILIKTDTKTIERKYETIKLTESVSVERLTEQVFIDGNHIETKAKSYLVGNKIKNGTIELFDKSIRELHRRYNIYHHPPTEDLKFARRHQDDPFTIIKELGDNWGESLELLQDKYWDNTLRDLQGFELPKRLRFDYMVSIDESRFDLQGLLSHISCIESFNIISKGIADIPYYNSEEGRRKHIEFEILPTVEEWKEILNHKPSKEMYVGGDGMKLKAMSYYGLLDYTK